MSLGETSSSIREDRHPTGIGIIDEEVLRGIPKGSTIALLGNADSGAELVMYALATTNRRTEYVSTSRPKESVMESILSTVEDDNTVDSDEIRDKITVRDIKGGTDSFGDVLRKSSDVVDDGNLIVDTMSSRHDSPKDMMSIVRRIYTKTRRNRGLSYLYFVANDPSDLSRYEREVLQMVDGVFNIQTSVVGEDNIENYMFINKLRGVDIPKEAQNLVFGKSVTIDPTGDIG